MIQLITEPIKEWFRRRARREPYAEIIFSERLRAHMEIAAAAADVEDLSGRARLNDLMLKNFVILSPLTIKLINAVTFAPAGPQPNTEVMKAFLDLVEHLRKELRIEQIDDEVLREILRRPKKERP